MAPQLAALILVSRGAPALAAFYRETLGLPLRQSQHAGGEALHFSCDLAGVHFAIHPVENWPHAPELGRGAARVSLRVDDAGEIAARLRARGVRFEGPIAADWGTVLRLRDPDGNYLELVQGA